MVFSFPISGGVLDGKAVEKPLPGWPEEVRDVEGLVVVQVMVDEQGKVITARAVKGPEALHQVAVEAAYKAVSVQLGKSVLPPSVAAW